MTHSKRSSAFCATTFLAAVLLLLAGCGGGGGSASSSDSTTPPVSGQPSGKTGTVGLVITDGIEKDYDKILLSVTRVDLLGDRSAETIFRGNKTFDLKRLEGSGELFALSDTIPAGIYSKIRIYLDEIALIPKGGSMADAKYAELPRNGNFDLKPREKFAVEADGSLLIQLDFHAGKSFKLHETGKGRIKFRPVVFVSIMSGDGYERLSRVYGQIGEVDQADQRFQLCQKELLSDDDDDSDFDDEHCLSVYTQGNTGIFDNQGDPTDFSAIQSGDFATVAGMFRGDKDRRSVLARKGDDDDDEDDNEDDNDDEDDDDNDDRDSGDRDDDDEFERNHFAMDAAVVELGVRGTFESLKGRIDEDFAAATSEFGLEILPGQGYVDGSTVTGLLQPDARIFSKSGEPLDESYLVTDMVGYFDGVFELGNVNRYKTALIVLDIAPEGEDILRGEILEMRRSGFTMTTADGDRCVDVADSTDIFLISTEGDVLRSDRGTLDDLEPGQRIDVFGEEDVDGCFEAETVIVDRTGDDGDGNGAPSANAGDDQRVEAGANVMLDGSGSSDPDGDPLSFSWSLAVPDGSSAELAGADTEMPSFITDAVGSYQAELTVSDGEFSATDSVVVTAIDPNANDVPIAVAEAMPLEAGVGDSVTLDGSGSFDPEGQALSFSWMLQAPAGSAAAIADPAAELTSFQPDIAGEYIATLVVNDGELDSGPADVTVTAADAVIIDGAALYSENCSDCHGAIDSIRLMPVDKRNVADISTAIAENKGGMDTPSLNALSDEELQAIVDAMAAANP
jgi:mono/diheme cytochrome c family protein